MLAVAAAILFAIGFVVRLIDGTSAHDPWVYAFLGLLALALAAALGHPLPWQRQQRQQ